MDRMGDILFVRRGRCPGICRGSPSVTGMQPEKRSQRRWLGKAAMVGRTAAPYLFAVSALALGIGAVVESMPIAGACGAVLGVIACLIEQRRARFHRKHVETLRKRLRKQRVESEQAAAQLRQTVSSLQTELWQQRMVALATPAFGIPLAAPDGSPPAEQAPAEPTGAEPQERRSEPVARAS
jgi:hypothetical protein